MNFRNNNFTRLEWPAARLMKNGPRQGRGVPMSCETEHIASHFRHKLVIASLQTQKDQRPSLDGISISTKRRSRYVSIISGVVAQPTFVTFASARTCRTTCGWKLISRFKKENNLSCPLCTSDKWLNGVLRGVDDTLRSFVYRLKSRPPHHRHRPSTHEYTCLTIVF